MGNWKAIRKRPGAALELYDLGRDLAERLRTWRTQHPDVVARIEQYLKTARSESKMANQGRRHEGWTLIARRRAKPAIEVNAFP